MRTTKNNKTAAVLAAASAGALFAALLLLSCGNRSRAAGAGPARNGAAQNAEPETVYAVSVYKAGEGVLDDYLEFGGDIAASSSVDILPDTAGKVSRVYVSVGDYIEKDGVIADIDASRAGMNYTTNRVKAPISGTLTSFTPSVGSTVAPSVPMGQISNTATLEVKTAVPERFVSRVALGQRAELLFDAWPGKTFGAFVTQISPVLDTSTRTMPVKLQISPADSRVKVGMYARVKLITDKKKGIVVPYSALINRGGQTRVCVVGSDNKVTLKTVEAGIRVDDWVELLSGVDAGDSVVVKGQSLLDEGSAVNIVHTGEGGVQ